MRVNEWYDFIELYNSNALPVPLGGLFLTDDPSEIGRRKYQIPALSFIAGSGFATYTATGFNVDYAGGEYLRLAQSNDTQLDAVSFGALAFAQGRSPDGSATIANFAASAGFANVQGTNPAFTSFTGSVVNFPGRYVLFNVTTANITSYQWYKDGTPLIGATTAIYEILACNFADDGTYTCTATGPGGSITTPPMKLTVLHTFDSWAGFHGIFGAATDGDADGDGIKNLAEFLTNTSPVLAATTAERIAHQVLGTLELNAGVPTFQTLDFRLNRRAAFTGFGVDISADLATWAAATPDSTELLSTETNGDQHWRMKFAVPGGTPKRFLRLNITE